MNDAASTIIIGGLINFALFSGLTLIVQGLEGGFGWPSRGRDWGLIAIGIALVVLAGLGLWAVLHIISRT